MKPAKLINALKHIDQVLEGIKNNIFKDDDIEIIANERWKICRECSLVDFDGKNCAAPGTQPCCSECGCSLAFKMRALSTSCPHPEGSKWGSVITEEEEDELNAKNNGNNI